MASEMDKCHQEVKTKITIDDQTLMVMKMDADVFLGKDLDFLLL